MNTKTPPTTAAELLAEWERFNELRVIAHVRKDRDIEANCKNECATRAARLDEMCEDAGISIKDGRFCYSSHKLYVDYRVGVQLNYLNLPTREQQALQEWLLIKESI